MLSSKNITPKGLLQKGWTQEEIEQVFFILDEAPRYKSTWMMRFDKVMYWLCLCLGLLGNFVMAVLLIPLLIVANSFWLFVMVFFFAFAFGLLFTLLLEHIEILHPQHHALNWVILPVFSFITVAIIASLTQYVEGLLQITIQVQNYWIIALTYTVAFMLPYFLFLHRERLILRSEKLL